MAALPDLECSYDSAATLQVGEAAALVEVGWLQGGVAWRAARTPLLLLAARGRRPGRAALRVPLIGQLDRPAFRQAMTSWYNWVQTLRSLQ